MQDRVSSKLSQSSTIQRCYSMIKKCQNHSQKVVGKIRENLELGEKCKKKKKKKMEAASDSRVDES